MDRPPEADLQESEIVAAPDAAATRAELSERRHGRRKPVIKSAKLLVNEAGSTLNCFVIDESPEGAQIDLGAMVELPDELMIQFNSGTYLARRCWSAGTRVGLHYTGPPLVSADAAARKQKIAELLQSQGLGAAVKMLRSARFFDDEELRRAAETAEAGALRLEAMLRGE